MDITLQKSPPLIGPIKFAIGHDFRVPLGVERKRALLQPEQV
jgi:hypothetical protein